MLRGTQSLCATLGANIPVSIKWLMPENARKIDFLGPQVETDKFTLLLLQGLQNNFLDIFKHESFYINLEISTPLFSM